MTAYIVGMYKRGVSYFWTGEEWNRNQSAAHRWQEKSEAEAFAADVQGPWEAVVLEVSP